MEAISKRKSYEGTLVELIESSGFRGWHEFNEDSSVGNVEKQEEVQEEGELVAVSARALWKKSWKRREEEEEEDGFRSLSLFFHFGPLFFRPFIASSYLSLFLSLHRPRVFPIRVVSPAPTTSLWTFFYDFLILVKGHVEGARLKDKRT